jgi:hypothetical protein
MGGGIAPTGAGGNSFTDCGRVQSAPRVPPNIVIALDASRAMGETPCSSCGPASRWMNATDAITATVQVTQADVKWGLALFGDDASACGASGAVDVGVALGAGPSIADVLARQTVNGGATSVADRQIRNAVLATSHHLAASSWDPSFIVLISAGAPSCAVAAAPISDDTTATVEATRSAFVGGIGTFVLGVGTFDAAANASLELIASAGNPGLTGPVPNLFVAFSSAEVQTVLRTVVQATEGCTFRIPSPPNPTETSHLSVFFGDSEIPQDSAQGWDYFDATRQSFKLYGAACDLARANRAELPRVRFRCLGVS